MNDTFHGTWELYSLCPLFSVHSAYVGSDQFTTQEGQAYLRDHHIDIVGLSALLSNILPKSTAKLSPAELEEWLSSPEAAEAFNKTEVSRVLASGGLHKAGSIPFVYLKNEDLGCHGAEVHYCGKHGTPTGLNGSTPEERFRWWTDIFFALMGFLKGVDSSLSCVHIWNEPDLVWRGSAVCGVVGDCGMWLCDSVIYM